MKKLKKVFFGFFLLLFISLLSVVLARPSFGDTFRIGENVFIPSDEVIEGDLICLGHSIRIDGLVEGDVIAIGMDIQNNGTINGNLWVAGQRLQIHGFVLKEILFIGQSLILGPDSLVKGRVKAAGYSFELKPGASIQNDARFFGYQALLSGNIGGSFKGAVRAIILDGAITGNVRVKVGATPRKSYRRIHHRQNARMPYVEPGLFVGESAQIGGMLFYESHKAARIDPKANLEGRIIQDGKIFGETFGPLIVGFGMTNLNRFLTYFIFGILLFWLFGYWMRRLAETIRHHTLASFLFGVGAIFLIVFLLCAVPALTVLLSILSIMMSLTGVLLILVGIGLLFEIVLIIGFLLYIAVIPQVVVSFLIGRKVLKKINPDWNVGRLLPFTLGLIVYVFLTSIPIVNYILTVVITILGLGALLKLRTANPYVRL
ncbi:polymer-forming cytoskeletal protein [PVC group bacterium]|nr:polymer-forming cytoskeletal protein [PVC group bacterium]